MRLIFSIQVISVILNVYLVLIIDHVNFKPAVFEEKDISAVLVCVLLNKAFDYIPLVAIDYQLTGVPSTNRALPLTRGSAVIYLDHVF